MGWAFDWFKKKKKKFNKICPVLIWGIRCKNMEPAGFVIYIHINSMIRRLLPLKFVEVIGG